jgi:hypothetical protein
MTPSVHRLTPIMKKSDDGIWMIAMPFRVMLIVDHPKDDNGRLQPRSPVPSEVGRGS